MRIYGDTHLDQILVPLLHLLSLLGYSSTKAYPFCRVMYVRRLRAVTYEHIMMYVSIGYRALSLGTYVSYHYVRTCVTPSAVKKPFRFSMSAITIKTFGFFFCASTFPVMKICAKTEKRSVLHFLPEFIF